MSTNHEAVSRSSSSHHSIEYKWSLSHSKQLG